MFLRDFNLSNSGTQQIDTVIAKSSPTTESILVYCYPLPQPSSILSYYTNILSNNRNKLQRVPGSSAKTTISKTLNLLYFWYACEFKIPVFPFCLQCVNMSCKLFFLWFNSYQMCLSVFLPAYSYKHLTASLLVFAVRPSSGHLSFCLIVYCLPLSGLQLLPHKLGWDLSSCQMRITTQNRWSWLGETKPERRIKKR